MKKESHHKLRFELLNSNGEKIGIKQFLRLLYIALSIFAISVIAVYISYFAKF